MKKVLLSAAVVALMGLSSCGGGTSLCDCVNMEDMNEECKTMKDEYRAKYEKASDEEKEKMQAEEKACKEEKKEEKAEEGGH